MPVSESQYQKACITSLLHDLQVIKGCAGYHALNKFNPFSVKFSLQFNSLFHQEDLLYREINDLVENPGFFEQDCHE